jgi:hypothetical protein
MGIGALSLLRSPEITAPAAAATAATVTMMVMNTKTTVPHWLRNVIH